MTDNKQILEEILRQQGAPEKALSKIEEITLDEFRQDVLASQYALFQEANKYEVMVRQAEHMEREGYNVIYYRMGNVSGFATYAEPPQEEQLQK